MPDLERGCRKACDSSDRHLTREKYLCSGKYIDEAQYMLSYGHDPCPDWGLTMDDVLDPTNSFEKNQENLKNLTPVFIGIGALVLVGIIALAWSIKK